MKIKKLRRARRKGIKSMVKSIRFLGVNANGLKSRMFTFKKVLRDLKPAVFFVEETKHKEEGTLKLDSFTIFELTRESRDGGGGLALGVVNELCPVLVRKGNDNVEVFSINIFVKSMGIRCCIAYGCQETSNVEKKNNFWNFIEEEVNSAKSAGFGFILHFDGNLWAGSKIIPGDPRQQNNNGKLFQKFLERNKALNVVNALPICEGLITRKRMKNGDEEKSVLDFFVVCSRVLPFVTKMVIDEDKKYILTNYKNAKNGGKAIETDHFTQYMDIKLQYISEKPQRREIFNFKNKKSQEKFRAITSNTKQFSDCFKNNLSFENQINKWRQVLNSQCQKAFKKIRINKRKEKPLNEKLAKLVDKRNQLKMISKNTDDGNLLEVERAISTLEAEENRTMIMKHFKQFNDDPENINLNNLWKVFKKLGLNYKNTIPAAKKDYKGNIISDPTQIKKPLGNEYKLRLIEKGLLEQIWEI